jgi:hypothetical protein
MKYNRFNDVETNTLQWSTCLEYPKPGFRGAPITGSSGTSMYMLKELTVARD